MKIKINHIAKIEGHAGFVANIVKGDVESAKIEIKSSARLIEGLLIGRYYKNKVHFDHKSTIDLL